MKHLLTALLAANCLYVGGQMLWPQPTPTIPGTPPPLAGPPLRLLSEIAQVELVEPTSAESAVDSTARVCLVSAPFSDRADAERRSAEIAAAGELVELIETTPRAEPTGDFLVFIEPPESPATARTVCTELAQRDLECHAIPSGTLAGALSVGVFSRRALAERQLQRVAALGYSTQLTRLGAPASEYRLLMPAASDPVLADISWLPCPSIADTAGLL
jgi:hypothetical protein